MHNIYSSNHDTLKWFSDDNDDLAVKMNSEPERIQKYCFYIKESKQKQKKNIGKKFNSFRFGHCS